MNNPNYKDIDWKLESSNINTTVFYKLNDKDPKAFDSLLKRAENKIYSHLYVCTESKYSNSQNITFLNFHDWASKQTQILSSLYPLDLRTKFIAITGTNGKTTTADFIRQICVNQTIPVLCIGTLGVWYNDNKVEDFGLTTPNYIDFRKFIHKYKSKIVVFETSSHAIEQQRFLDFKIDVAAWTSFSQDHLDYHLTMDKYYQAKLMLFNSLKREDTFFYHKSDLDLHQSTKELTLSKIDYQSNKEFLKISYNKNNLDLAITCLESIGLKPLNNYDFLNPAPGRFNTYKYKDLTIIIDYAHTPDAVMNICKESKKAFNKKVVTIFGCGGDRDVTKRPLMGVAACSNSDEVIITSDNPRFENLDNILKDITDGLVKFNNYKIIKDRSSAIKETIKNAKDCIVLILGKGHEPYLDVMGSKIDYSDIETVKRCINE